MPAVPVIAGPGRSTTEPTRVTSRWNSSWFRGGVIRQQCRDAIREGVPPTWPEAAAPSSVSGAYGRSSMDSRSASGRSVSLAFVTRRSAVTLQDGAAALVADVLIHQRVARAVVLSGALVRLVSARSMRCARW